MPPGVQYTPIFVYALHVDTQLLFKYRYLLGGGHGMSVGIAVQIIPHFLEHPRPPKRGAPYHHGIYAIVLKGPFGLLGRSDVAIADNGNMDARIVFHLSYQ